MPSVEIRPEVYWIGLNDRTTDLFEGIWPVSHEGVTYNSYLLRDEKKVIIDLAKGFKTDEYFECIDALVPLSEIDYIVVNHMEPDHTGAIRPDPHPSQAHHPGHGKGQRDAGCLLRDHRKRARGLRR